MMSSQRNIKRGMKKIIDTHAKPWAQLNTPHVARILNMMSLFIELGHYDHDWNSDLQKSQY